jgi:hypothetical protein
MRYILAKNDSLTNYQTFEPSELQQTIKHALKKPQYNTIFIGDNNVASAINDVNRQQTPANNKFKFLHSSINPPYKTTSTT